jgi:neutral trehalase
VLRNTRVMSAADLSAYVVLQLDALRTMALRLDRPDEARVFAESASELRERMNRLLWSERDGLYYDLDGAGVPVPVRTIAALLPLWAGVPTQPQARRMLGLIRDPTHFGTLIPLPSVDRSERAFEKDMWRGPVWVNTAYGVLQGLLRYGFQREAADLAFRLCRGVYEVFAREHQVFEFYDPDAWHTRDLRRKRGNWWKALTLGRGPQRDFVGWTGLVNTLVLEVLLGLRPAREGFSLCPRLPPACAGTTWAVQLPGWGGRVTVSVVAEDRFEGAWERDGRSTPFSTTFGQRIHLQRTGAACVTAT